MAFWNRNKPDHPRTLALVLAGGSARRFGENKLLATIGGIPVLVRTMQALDLAECIDEIILVAREDEMEHYGALAQEYGIGKLTKVIRGGDSRAGSAYNGILQADRSVRFVAVHDAARPMGSPAMIDRVCRKAYEAGAAFPAVPVADTVRQQEAGDNGAWKTLPRARLAAAQTPQAADIELLRAALKAALESGEEATDDCAALERLGVRPMPAEGERRNIKITVPEDLLFAEALLKAEEQ